MSEELTRPGPLSIDPGECPGGLVIHIYSVPTNELLRVSRLTIDDDVEAAAIADGEVANAVLGDVCLVIYDGDTGTRVRGLDLEDVLRATMGLDPLA